MVGLFTGNKKKIWKGVGTTIKHVFCNSFVLTETESYWHGMKSGYSMKRHWPIAGKKAASWKYLPESTMHKRCS
jgi:hypothetical protein